MAGNSDIARRQNKQGTALTHGHSVGGVVSRTYRSWYQMLDRCRRPACCDYKYYGGRGITVCKRWLSFANFLADMGDRPANTSIDRINNDGNYEPGNCRWATRAEQAANRRIPEKIGNLPRGVEAKNGKFRSRLWRNGRVVHLGMFPALEAAVTAYEQAAAQRGTVPEENRPGER